MGIDAVARMDSFDRLELSSWVDRVVRKEVESMVDATLPQAVGA